MLDALDADDGVLDALDADDGVLESLDPDDGVLDALDADDGVLDALDADELEMHSSEYFATIHQRLCRFTNDTTSSAANANSKSTGAAAKNSFEFRCTPVSVCRPTAGSKTARIK